VEGFCVAAWAPLLRLVVGPAPTASAPRVMCKDHREARQRVCAELQVTLPYRSYVVRTVLHWRDGMLGQLVDDDGPAIWVPATQKVALCTLSTSGYRVKC